MIEKVEGIKSFDFRGNGRVRFSSVRYTDVVNRENLFLISF